MSNIPLLDQFIAENKLVSGNRLTASQFESAVERFAKIGENTDVPGSTATALYSGDINGQFSFKIAKDLADRSGGQLRIIDNTKIGKFLLHITDEAEISKYVDLGNSRPGDVSTSAFKIASKEFALNTNGPGNVFDEKQLFVQQTGAYDGFLVIDRNGNGVIDDITEMFGAPDVGGYSELAELDAVDNGGNGDGFITVDDAMFAQLQVWRDLDQDGQSDVNTKSGRTHRACLSLWAANDNEILRKTA